MAKETSLLDEIVSLQSAEVLSFNHPRFTEVSTAFLTTVLGGRVGENIKDAWWEDMVRRRDDMVGLDSGIIMNPKVWQASGHVDGFTDPMVDCKESKMRYRADQLFAAEVRVEGTSLGWISLIESERMEDEAKEKADLLKRKAAMQGALDSLDLRPYDELESGEQSQVPSPATGKAGSLTPPREFNMMFETHVGALRDGSSLCYLRPETAQGIFANFKNAWIPVGSKSPLALPKSGKPFETRLPREISFSDLVNSSKWKSSISSLRAKSNGGGITGNGSIPEKHGLAP